jgi:hypothetical protein
MKTMNTMAAPVIGKQRHRFSRDEYLRMSELGLFGGKRVELIDGEILEMAAQKNRHAQGVLVKRQLEAHRDSTADPSQPFGFRYASITAHLPGSQVAPLARPGDLLDVSSLFI